MSIEIVISLLAAIGVSGILAVLLNRHFDQQKLIIEHDVKIFNQSNRIISEQKLSELIELDLLDDHSIINEDIESLINWCMFFEQTGNQYIDKSINKANQKLLDRVNQLTDFISFNSAKSRFQDPRGAIRDLKPHWKPDHDNHSNSDSVPSEYVAKYEELVRDLRSLTSKVKHQYSEYRLTVKQRLKI